MWFVDVAMANTGVAQVDTILNNFRLLITTVVGAMIGGYASMKGAQHFGDEGGGHLGGSRLMAMAPGAVLGGAGFPIAAWMTGIGAASELGALLQPMAWMAFGHSLLFAALNPVGPVAFMLGILSLRRRGARGTHA